MLIVGAGGLAKDVVTSWELDPLNENEDLCLFDNINIDKTYFFDKYKLLHTENEVQTYFKEKDNKFFVCIGNPLLRKRITERFEQLGGELVFFVSCKVSCVSPFMTLAPGVVIEPGTLVSKDAILEKGVFINAGTIIGHDAIIHEYVSLGPGVRVLGGAEIGEFSYIGTNAVIMPGVKIGKKVRIGVGKIIDQDVPDNSKIL
jgi:sugar O-acyltransferase (sialic acid O-acetyltransferase NeuD family)